MNNALTYLLEKYPDKKWKCCWKKVSLKYIIEHKDKNWDWYTISRNIDITVKDILDNLDLPWSWYSLSENPNISIKDVISSLDNPLCRWHFPSLALNPNMTIKDISFFQKKYHFTKWDEWSWVNLSKNPNISIEDIQKHPEFPWSWNGISQNPNITLEFIEKNEYFIDFEVLTFNKLTRINQHMLLKHLKLPEDISKYIQNFV